LSSSAEALGDAAVKDAVARVIAGELLLLPALNEVGVALPAAPTTTLVDGRVSGRKLAVPVYAEQATLLLVSASSRGVSSGDGPVVALVDPAAEGVTAIATPSSRGLAEATYSF